MYSSDADNDNTTLKRLAEGDEAAFRTIYDKYWEKLLNAAFVSLRDREYAREIVHDVLLDLWKRKAEVTIVNLEAYLKAAVRFRVINFVNRRRTPVFFEVFDNITASPYLADNKLLEADFIALIGAWAEILPEKRREIFISYFFDQLNTREIAEKFGISQKTVQNQIGTSLQKLRSRFRWVWVLLYFAFY